MNVERARCSIQLVVGKLYVQNLAKIHQWTHPCSKLLRAWLLLIWAFNQGLPFGSCLCQLSALAPLTLWYAL